MRKVTVTLALTMLVAAGLAGRCSADVKDLINLDFSKPADQAMMMLNGTGSAAFTDGRLELIDGSGSEASSAFVTTPFQVSDYLATFDFEIKANDGDTNPADGFAFLAQTAGPDHVGGGGGAIGLARTDTGALPDPSNPAGGGFPGYSYGIEFNSWTDQGLPADAGDRYTVALDLNGVRSKIGITPFNPVDAGVLHAEVRVTPAQLVMNITKAGGTKPIFTFTSPPWLVSFFDAPKPLFFGFTGATGGSVETADVLNLRVQTGLPAPTPPSTAGQ